MGETGLKVVQLLGTGQNSELCGGHRIIMGLREDIRDQYMSNDMNKIMLKTLINQYARLKK